MSEKRFVLCKRGDVEYIEDNGCVQLYGFDVLCEMLNEQQATIRKLQDLCGESDSENAKLRIENKRLQAENEQLRKELNDCEKFRYTVFKRLNDEQIKECSIR